ncbi:MAG: helix-turn-helix domain-containing protein [Actinobacteria bacterium]|nr:helix-turn-helix domain-containing protein [Actinomycetota bacterium]
MSDLAVIAEMARPGDSIRARRTDLGWTQAELAERSGVSQADISRIENGQLDARWSTIHRLSEALEAPGEPARRSLANGHRRNPPAPRRSKRWTPKGETKVIKDR